MEVDQGMGSSMDDQLAGFFNTVTLGVPVSTVLSLASFGEMEVDGLAKVFDGLVHVAEQLASTEMVDQLQRALLDVVEFMVVYKEKLCTYDREMLVGLRKLVLRFEELVQKTKTKVDYRAFSIFMENKVGDVSLNELGTISSEFNKIKSKMFRGFKLSWEEREQLIEKLLSNVTDKRRGFLIEGRSEVRGYGDMSDQELLGWSTLAGELTFGGDDDN